MKKFLIFKKNTIGEPYQDVLYWIYNNKGDDLGSIEKFKFGRKIRLSSKLDDDVFMTSECLRQLADFLDEKEKEIV